MDKFQDSFRKFVVTTFLFGAALIAGCAGTTTWVPADQAKPVPAGRILGMQKQTPEASGRIVVTRDAGSIGYMCLNEVRLNGQIVARYDIGETASFWVPPGDVLVRAGADTAGSGICNSGSWIQRESTIKAGEVKYFRITRTLETLDVQRVER